MSSDNPVPGSAPQYDAVRALDAVVAALRARHPDLIDLTTGRVLRLLHALGDPQRRLPPVMHVAGTNGKGSVCAYLRAMAEAAGLKAHVMTSPHLVRFAERIRVAGRLIEDEAIARLIEQVEATNAGEPISFFELAVAIALQAFAQAPADVAIIEVGLGGRFDASNVFDHPAATVITPVDYDHLELLGPDLGRIAWEKAGIMRAGVPCIVARQQAEAMKVIEDEAQLVGAPLLVMGRDFDAWSERGRLVVQMEDRLLDLPAPSLAGDHQVANAGLAVAAALSVRSPVLDPEGISRATWPARCQRLDKGPLGEAAKKAGATLWLDGGHNPHAGEALARTLEDIVARDARPVTLVVGMLNRKDAKGFLAPFKRLGASVVATSFDSPNAQSSAEIAAAARAAGLEVVEAKDVSTAVAQALNSEKPPHILICGGLHFAGDVLALSPETWPS
jgi:dihydrofolate synthase/folylpolyglutamate synthase